jgi:Ribosomal protein S11
VAKAQAKSRKKKSLKLSRKALYMSRPAFNNTIISITDRNGNVIAWASAGVAGFKGHVKTHHLLHHLQQKK